MTKEKYQVKKGKAKDTRVVVLKPRRMTIYLESATQEQLKLLYEVIKHPFIEKV